MDGYGHRWHILKKAAYWRDACFSKNVLVVSPSLTVKERLQVLLLTAEPMTFIWPATLRRREAAHWT